MIISILIRMYRIGERYNYLNRVRASNEVQRTSLDHLDTRQSPETCDRYKVFQRGPHVFNYIQSYPIRRVINPLTGYSQVIFENLCLSTSVYKRPKQKAINHLMENFISQLIIQFDRDKENKS